ncbi:hypothetical protein [Streptomyces sp. NPDC004285]
MTDIVRTPWTSEQVQALNNSQEHGTRPPRICGAEVHATGRSPLLDATHAGWICPDPACTYTSDWEWRSALDYAAGLRDAARQTTTHACDNCDGIDPASCLTNPDRAARQTTGQDDTGPAHPTLGITSEQALTGAAALGSTLKAAQPSGAALTVVEETHVVADDSDDPEHIDDCPGCEVGIEHTEHCPSPETHNWGCGCPTDRWPAAKAREALAGYLGGNGNDPKLALLLNDYHQAVAAETRAAVGQPAEAHDTDRAAVLRDAATMLWHQTNGLSQHGEGVRWACEQLRRMAAAADTVEDER